MAITEVPEYAHLSEADLEELAAGLEAIRHDIEASRGAKDRAYIMRAIAFQRCLEIVARLVIARSKGRFGWAVGTAALAAAKCIENMELGHNISHGQWDWMNDPEIHSNVWEWDMAGLTSQWRNSHNYRHHVYANVVGVDDDLGFGIMRVTRDQEWRPSALAQPLRAVLLALAFEWGVALHGLYSVQERETTDAGKTCPQNGADPQDGSPGRQGLCSVSRVESPTVAPHPGGQRDCQRAAQCVGVCGHCLRSLHRRGGKVHPGSAGGRDEARVVSAANAGHRELPGRDGNGVHEWKSLLPNRTPPLPRSAE